MNLKRILGITLFVIGLALFVTSYYITGQIEEGKRQITSAQKKVDNANSLFSLSPTTKEVGKPLTDSAQKKIDAGKQAVNDYTTLAGQLHLAGIIVSLAGIVLIIFGRSRKKKKS